MGTFIRTTFTDIFGDTFVIEINDSTYSDTVNVVNGRCTLEYPEVKLMDVVRGSQLSIELEENFNDTWFQRLVDSVGDKKLQVTLDKNGSRFWNGWLKADGIIRNYVTDRWITNITAIDGLGLLENISFLDSNGDAYSGLQNELDLTLRCLELTGINIDVRFFSFNLFYTVNGNDPIASHRALRYSYVNADRFQKDDQEKSVFTAKEVLEACLKKYGAFVCQQGNMFNLVRILDFHNTDVRQSFVDFQLDGTFIQSATAVMKKDLGSQVNSFFPHHALGNQQIAYNAALGAYKVIYTYGFVKSILDNPTLIWSTTTNIDNWTYSDINDFDVELQSDGTYRGFLLSNELQGLPLVPLITELEEALESDISTSNEVAATELIQIEINGTATHKAARHLLYCRIELITDSNVTYYLNTNGEWTLTEAVIRLFDSTNDNFYNALPSNYPPKTFTFSTKIEANTIVEDGNVQIIFYKGIYDTGLFNNETLAKVDITNVSIRGAQGNFTAESHTAKRITNAVSIVETEDKVYSGDNASDIYIGAIEDENENLTRLWAKSNVNVVDPSDIRPLLEWLSRDRLTISSGNSTIFSGGIYGYLEYLSQLSIDNIDGVFMTTSYNYDISNGLIDAKHVRIFNDDIEEDVLYEFNYEDANVVRPTIE